MNSSVWYIEISIAEMAAGTECEFKPEQIELLSSLLLESTRWMLRGKRKPRLSRLNPQSLLDILLFDDNIAHEAARLAVKSSTKAIHDFQ